MKPDFMYCMDMLRETGIQTVPGSGFGQKEGTYHLRLTNLVNPTEKMRETMVKMDQFNTKFHSQRR
jgi:alanine transaminase